MNTLLKIKKIHQHAITPYRASSGSAGFDLFSCDNYNIKPLGKVKVHTGICIELSRNHYGRIAPRSGLAWKHFIDVGAGVIDEDYRGELIVILYNFSNKIFKINSGNKIAQLIIQQYETPTIIVVNKLSKTKRESGGFGSTGY
jgi:dUTP pyrophosphatase